VSHRAALWALALLALVGVFAPLLAGDVPLIAKTRDGLQFPGVVAAMGYAAPAPPSESTWKAWWYRQAGSHPENPDQWAVMPLWPWGPLEVSPAVLARPSLRHLLGTDDTGRDVLARLIHGASTSLWIGLGTALLAALLGVPLGALAGYFAFGWLDALVLRLIELGMCFPSLFLALSVTAMLGTSTAGLVLVLGLVYWPRYARIVRGEFLSLRQREFVLAARNLGVPTVRILTRHMLPQVTGQVLVAAAFGASGAMIVEASMSFLGLGIGLQQVSWGSMLAQGKEHAHLGAWHLWVFPGLALAGTVLTLHKAADAPAR
jgi:peptide/nickel transport system permease protein